MKYPSLRCIAPAEISARTALAHWPRRDAALTGRLAYSPLPRRSSVVGVQAYRHGLRWCGYVDLMEWLANTAPELAGLACAAGDQIENAQNLFDASERPLDMPFPELGYDVLRMQQDVLQSETQPEIRHDQCLLSVVTPQGHVWLSNFPDLAAPATSVVSASMQALPLALAWHVGSSYASCRLVGGLRCGDVLLIGREEFELTSAGIAIGRFSINENGEITVQAENLKELKETPMQEHVEARNAASLGDIPLRLDFILQRRMMTVAELDALYNGQVLQLDPQAEKQVEITVNGMRLATGELVELNGRLGVELHDIAVGKPFTGTHRV